MNVDFYKKKSEHRDNFKIKDHTAAVLLSYGSKLPY